MPYRFPKGGIAPRSQSGKSWESSFSVASRACETELGKLLFGGEPGMRNAQHRAQLREIHYLVGGKHHNAVAVFSKEDDHLGHLLSRQVFGRGNFAGRVSERVNGVGVGHAAAVQ